MNNDTDIRTGADHLGRGRSALPRPGATESDAGEMAHETADGDGLPLKPYRVCFVCTGNICRSPMAEWVLRAQVAESGLSDVVEVDSAGTGDWHVGDGADPRTVRVLARHGYPSRHVARQFRPAELLSRDLVIALDHGHLRTLRRWATSVSGGRPGMRGAMDVGTARADTAEGDPRLAELRLLREFDPAAPPDRLDVPDPYYGSLAGFEECLAMVQDAMPGLLSHIALALETRAG